MRTTQLYVNQCVKAIVHQQEVDCLKTIIKDIMGQYTDKEIPDEQEFAEKLSKATNTECSATYQGAEIDDGCLFDDSGNTYVMKDWLNVSIGNEQFTIKMYYGDYDSILGDWEILD